MPTGAGEWYKKVMKIIHAADLHLGSRLVSKFPADITEQRRAEVRNAFKRLVDYAEQNGVAAILLAGDVFDSDRPFKKDKELFYAVIAAHPQIQFYYLRGNHDVDTAADITYDNLHCFGSQWQSYQLDGVVITGLEMNGHNATALYSSLHLASDTVNVVMLHGETSDGVGNGKINLKKLAGKNIDYLALGHIHKPNSGRVDERGVYVYPGCLEGRGFDEMGEHGFVLLNIERGKVRHEFVPFASRTIIEHTVDITGCANAYAAYKRITEQVDFARRDLYRINVTGEIDFDTEDLAKELQEYLSNACYFVDVKDQTKRRVDLATYAKDLSLRGEFVRTVMTDSSLSETDRQRIIAYGLRALSGERWQ